MTPIEKDAIEEATILGDFSLANKLELQAMEKLLIEIAKDNYEIQRGLCATPLFETKDKSCGRLEGVLLAEKTECDVCCGDGTEECCECGQDTDCEECDGTGHIYSNHKKLTLNEFYELTDSLNRMYFESTLHSR